MSDKATLGFIAVVVCLWFVLLWLALRQPGQATRKGKRMTKQEIIDAIEFLKRVFVGPADVDRLEAAIKALQTELKRRNKK